ncbi:hypothetical protein I549_4618 [Mycobacterium avium subsp. avium 2285 (R)]|nr:hypothetical protein I549_4618 [Mycobacterium avium subsp. avium 2285 (R)]
MARTRNHGDGRGALDLDVLQKTQVRETALRGKPDAQPVRPDALRGPDQEPVDVGTAETCVGQRGRAGLGGQFERCRAGPKRHPGHPQPDQVDVRAAHGRSFGRRSPR